MPNIVGQLLSYVPQVFGLQGEGPVNIDLRELAQVYEVRDALRLSVSKFRVCYRTISFAGAGQNTADFDPWVTGSGLTWGGDSGPVPLGEDILVVGCSIVAGSNAAAVTAAGLKVCFNGISVYHPIAYATAGASAVYGDLNLRVTGLPLYLTRPRISRAGAAPPFRLYGDVTAGISVTGFLLMYTAAPGVLPILP